MSKQPPPAPTASAIGPCPTIIQSVGRPGTGSSPRTIASPDHPLHSGQSSNINIVCMRHNLNGISDSLQRKINEPNRNYVSQSVCLSVLHARSISPKR